MADSTAAGLLAGPDGATRCWWAGDDEDYRLYHDNEWGRPTEDDTRLFEKICLEGFQAGLSWLTILRKRENFRSAFAGFDIATVAAFGPDDERRLMADAGIVRHRGKIAAAINNASRAKEVQAEWGSLGAYVWSFEPDPDSRPGQITHATLMQMTESEASRALSRDLKERGWRFVGPTTMYAFLQSMGVVNDHVDGCQQRQVVEDERTRFARPGVG